jgi:hypothetical protein
MDRASNPTAKTTENFNEGFMMREESKMLPNFDMYAWTYNLHDDHCEMMGTKANQLMQFTEL